MNLMAIILNGSGWDLNSSLLTTSSIEVKIKMKLYTLLKQILIVKSIVVFKSKEIVEFVSIWEKNMQIHKTWCLSDIVTKNLRTLRLFTSSNLHFIVHRIQRFFSLLFCYFFSKLLILILWNTFNSIIKLNKSKSTFPWKSYKRTPATTMNTINS